LRTNRAFNVRNPGNSKSRRVSHSVSARPSLAFHTLHRFETYLCRHALSPATIRNYLADLRAFARWHTTRQSTRDGLSSADFRAYRAHLCNGTDHSPATINRRLQSLRLFGRFLQETGQMPDNPMRGIALVRNGNTRSLTPRTLTRAQVARLLAAVRAARPSLAARDLTIMQLMLQVGLRVPQVAALRMDDVILAGKRASVRVRDNGVPRAVSLDASTVRVLRAYLPTRSAIPRVEHFFLSQRGQSLSIRSIQRLVEAHSRAAGLSNVSAQSLRRTCAKTMLAATRDAAAVARVLGCKDARTLDKYLSQ
jgi:site-specific recombinase XerD